MNIKYILLISFICLLAPSAVLAQDGGEDRWVTDSFEITLRKGKSNRQTIVRMLASGTKIELIEVDDEAGYSLVRTRGGTEGWVLNRYLRKSPPARVVMPDVEARLKASENKRKQLAADLKKLQRERNEFRGQLSNSEASGKGLEKELADLRRLSTNAIQLDADNKRLRQSLTDAEITIERLNSDNTRLGSRASREWFIIGALVVLFGILVGLILPRIRWRKKSSWGDL